MEMKEENRKTGKLTSQKFLKTALICFDIIFVLISVIVYAYRISHLEEIHFDASQIASFATADNIYDTFDESFAEGIYDVTTEWNQKKGYYVFSVSYEGSSDSSFLWPLSYSTYAKGFTQNPVYLSENNRAENGFWINHKIPVALRMYYSGRGNVKVTGFSMRETSVYPNRALFISLVILCLINLAVLLALYIRNKDVKASLIYCSMILLGLLFLSSLPALSDKVLALSDTEFHVARIESIKDGLLEGQFPVRISPDFYGGYGYATSIFYGEIFLYIPALLRIIGFSLTEAFNFYIFAINALTVFAAFAVFRRMFKNDWIALASCILYTLAPYRLCDLYIRGALGEYTALAFLPFVLDGMYRIYTCEKESREFKRAYIPLIIGLTGIIQSHTLSVEMTGGFIILVCLILVPLTVKKARFLELLKSAGLTLLINMWFIVPFLDYTKCMDLRFISSSGQKMVQSTGAFLPQLFYMFPKYADSANDLGKGFIDDLPTSLGPSLIFGCLICGASFIAVFADKKDESLNDGNKLPKGIIGGGIVLLAVSFLATWMATYYFPWDALFSFKQKIAVLVSTVQFVWRFLGIASLAAAACTGIGILVLNKKKELIARIVGAVLVSLSLIGGMYFIEMSMQNGNWHEYTDLNSLRFGTTTAAMGGEFVMTKAKHEVVTGISDPRGYDGASVISWGKMGTHVVMEVQNDSDGGYILLPLMNYKGYSVKSDDGLITKEFLGEGDAAEVRLNLPVGYKGTVHVRFVSPWYWRLAEVISILTLVGIVVFEIIFSKKLMKTDSSDLKKSN